ncbi:MAG: glycoside hydrolase family 18 protein [Mitsuaria chitosanitabida]|uniref:glycoside hydrolase family 18 protein n=1 Tax=Roseateles chitosanitabidus TaxID=65048 RepID=UPI001AFE5B9B|nr:glycoside hydrolase family 18 protein [Roseateles chitosanitabidus]MBO9687726.1 glycoside hydrolase family 18 protein [Roseateles chitosanitabidus]
MSVRVLSRVAVALSVLSVGAAFAADAPAAAAKPATTATAAETPGYPLFGGRPVEFERAGGKIVGMYVPNWEPVDLIERVPPQNLTHVLYAFLRLCGPGQLEKDAAKCVGKKDFEIGTGPIDERFNEAFQRYKQRAPHLKIVASVGGWGGSDPIFHLANDASRRAVFAASAQRFLRDHPAFDGIDIDWEHPGNNGAANGVQLGSPQDGQGYADLMADMRRALDALTAETGRPYLLTTAVNPMSPIVDRINFKQAAGPLDLVFMMSYDFYGNWSPVAGHHTALRSSAPEADDSLERAVRNLTRAGVPAGKLVAGVAGYGRGFTGVTATRAGTAKTGAYPGSDGSQGYREFAGRLIDAQGRGRQGYEVRFDAVTQSWSLYNPKLQLWLGYDDPRAVLAKGRFVRDHGLAGVFAWELSQDNGDLLNAMNRGVGNLVLAPASTTAKPKAAAAKP